MATMNVSILPDPADFEHAVARVQDYGDGHIASVKMVEPATGAIYCGQVTIQCSGDGANTLADGLEHLAAKVREAHRDWLRDKARAAERVEMAEAAGR